MPLISLFSNRFKPLGGGLAPAPEEGFLSAEDGTSLLGENGIYLDIDGNEITPTHRPTSTPTPTPTPTPTLASLDFTLDYGCVGGMPVSIQVSFGYPTGGVSPYFYGTTYFSTQADALANTNWNSLSGLVFPYVIGEHNMTVWVSIKDSAGTVKVKSITTDCTPTPPPIGYVSPYAYTLQYQYIDGSGNIYGWDDVTSACQGSANEITIYSDSNTLTNGMKFYMDMYGTQIVTIVSYTKYYYYYPAENKSFRWVNENRISEISSCMLPTPTNTVTPTPTPTSTPTITPTNTPTLTLTPTPTVTTNSGGAGWYFYAQEGPLTSGPPITSGNTIFVEYFAPPTGNTVTFNPNYDAAASKRLYFNVKDNSGTDYYSQFSGLINGGTITLVQNGDNTTFTAPAAGPFQINPNFFMIILSDQSLQTKISNAKFTYTDPITIRFGS